MPHFTDATAGERDIHTTEGEQMRSFIAFGNFDFVLSDFTFILHGLLSRGDLRDESSEVFRKCFFILYSKEIQLLVSFGKTRPKLR